MKSRILTLLLCFGLGSLTVSTTALAADDADALRSLNKLSILLDKSIMAYQMSKLDSGNPIYGAAVDQTTSRIRNLRNSYQQPAIQAKQQDELATLNKRVGNFLDELAQGEKKIASGGYEDDAVISDMYADKNAVQDSAQKLSKAIQQTGKVKVDPAVQEVRELAAMLQTMASNYIEQASSVSGSALRGGANRPLDQMSHEFASRLAKLNIKSDKVVGLNDKVRLVKGKWIFIENSMINFKQNTVPYLVYRYADSMVDDLLSIGDMYESRDSVQVQAPDIAPPEVGEVPLPPGIPAAKK